VRKGSNSRQYTGCVKEILPCKCSEPRIRKSEQRLSSGWQRMET
jgi:hypothetical protein